MRQNKTSFFIIIGVAVLALVAMVGLSFFLTGSLGSASPLQQQIEIQVVAAPSIQAWLEAAAQDFSETHPNTHIKVVAAGALIPSGQFRAAPPPAAWVAEASFVVEMAQNEGLQFSDSQSVAGTGLAWGGYNQKLDQLNQNYGELNWQTLQAKATSPEGLKLVIASPQNSAEGIAALIAAAAAHLNTSTLSRQEVNTAIPWLTATLGDRNAQTPPRPAEAFASAQGRTLGDVGLLSMASWRAVEQLGQSPDFSIRPAEPQVWLDYPYAIWAGSQSTPESQAAARAFRDFLLQEAQQSRLPNFFLEPVSAAQSGVQADGEAAEQLQSLAERVIR